MTHLYGLFRKLLVSTQRNLPMAAGIQRGKTKEILGWAAAGSVRQATGRQGLYNARKTQDQTATQSEGVAMNSSKRVRTIRFIFIDLSGFFTQI